MKRILLLIVSSLSLAVTTEADTKHLINCRDFKGSDRARVTFETDVICSSTKKPCLIYTVNGLVYWEADRDIIRRITPPPSPFYDPKIAVAWELIPSGASWSYIMTSFPDPFDDSGWWRGHLFKKTDHTKPEMVQVSELICMKPQRKIVR